MSAAVVSGLFNSIPAKFRDIHERNSNPDYVEKHSEIIAFIFLLYAVGLIFQGSKLFEPLAISWWIRIFLSFFAICIYAFLLKNYEGILRIIGCLFGSALVIALFVGFFMQIASEIPKETNQPILLIVFMGAGLLLLPLAYFFYVVAAFSSGVITIINTYSATKDRQAHLLFLLSMAALGWALWLQSGGHWQQMAVLDSPVVVPLLNWKIPLTDNLGFLFALLGFVHDPVAGSLSVASQAPISALTLFVAAGLLFLFAEIRLHKSEVGIQPRFALLAFVLFWATVFLDVALHWSGALVLPPELILFNRAFAVLAFAVYLFWRRVAKNGEPVRGADGVFKRACDWAEVEGWKIAAWLLGVLWLATELSYLWPSGFPEQVKYLLCVALLAVPVRKIIGFKHEFDSYLSAYRNAQQLERESYQPPPVIATADETRRALGDD